MKKKSGIEIKEKQKFCLWEESSDGQIRKFDTEHIKKILKKK